MFRVWALDAGGGNRSRFYAAEQYDLESRVTWHFGAGAISRRGGLLREGPMSFLIYARRNGRALAGRPCYDAHTRARVRAAMSVVGNVTKAGLI